MEISRLCIPYTPLEKELAESRVCIVSSTGVHLKDQEPYDTEGDTSFRIIPGDVDSSDLMITHTHYDHSDGDRDINVLFPIDRLRELAGGGAIGSVTTSHIGMGFTQAFRELREKTLPGVSDAIKHNKADIVLMTAGWPLCHRAVVSIQRGIELTGVSTVLITVEPDQSRMARPPRALWPVDYGLGNPLGGPDDPEGQKRILLEALNLVVNPSEPGKIYEFKIWSCLSSLR